MTKLWSRPCLRLLAVVLVSTGLLAACAQQDPADGRAPVVLIGLDGAEWQVIDAMIADGELPHLARIKAEGAWGHLLNPGPQISPVVWTTVATGHFGRQHGILDHVFPFTDEGAKQPLTSDLRQEPALWNVAGHYGQSTTSIGYFVTHPPEHIEGIIVSPLAPGDAPGSVWPTDALIRGKPALSSLRKSAEKQALFDRFFDWGYARNQARDPDSPHQAAARIIAEGNLDRRIIADEFLHRAALELKGRPANLFIAYYRLTDFMGHVLWAYYDAADAQTPPDPELTARFGEALKESYRVADEYVGNLLSAWEDRANVLIVSDHGFGAARGNKPAEQRRIKHLTGDHRPNGILLAIGPDIEPGEIKGLTIMEIAPTIATLMGLPVSDELPGAVATDLIRPEFLIEHPISTVATWRDVRVERGDSAMDEESRREQMKSLQGLGYVGAGVELSDASTVGGFDFWAVGDSALVGNLHAEIVYHLYRDDLSSAGNVMQLLQEQRPDLIASVVFQVRNKFRGLKEQLPEGYLNPRPFRQFLRRWEKDAQPGDDA